MPLKVLHVVASMDRHQGGPPAVVAGLAAAQAAAGLRPVVLTNDADDTTAQFASWRKMFPELTNVALLSRGSRQSSLGEMICAADIVHVHGIWKPSQAIALWLAQRAGVATVVAPHGMLAEWSLAQKTLKKRLALALIWSRLISRAGVVQALNAEEADSMALRFGPGVTIQIVPNGIAMEQFTAPVTHELHDRSPFVLFLARLHPQKAPDLLLEAFATIAAAEPALRLVIAGPDETGMSAMLEHRASELGLAGRVSLMGPVFDDLRLALLRSAVCVCQPSRFEGFSVTLLEALACGTPVVTTDAANFDEMVTAGAGLSVAPTPIAIGAALLALAHDPAERARRSRAASRLIESAFRWATIEPRVGAMYRDAMRHATGARRTDAAA